MVFHDNNLKLVCIDKKALKYLGHCQVYVIEAEVEPPPGTSCTAMVQTSSEECVEKELPPHAGKFTFLLPADIPRMFQINFKFRSSGEGRNQFGEGLIDEMKISVLTHYAPEGLQYFWDGHSLPAINVPIAKKPLVGILGKPAGQKILQYFQDLVENGAYHCFKRDQGRFFQHESATDLRFKDLALAIQLEESLLLYQMGNLEECKKLGEDVCAQADKFNSPNYNAITGKAMSVISGAYKQEGNFAKAEQILESSTEILESVVPGEETAINRTCVVALCSEKASTVGITKEEERKLKEASDTALIHYRHQLDQNVNSNARGPRRLLTRNMFYYLHSSRVKATDMLVQVSDKELQEVESFVQQFRRLFLDSCPRRDKALFLSARGDLFARKGEIEQGIRVVSEALQITEELHLTEDLIGARDRLQQLYLLRQRAGESRRVPLEIPERRLESNQRFQEPPCEVLQGYLDDLARVSRSRNSVCSLASEN